MSDNRPDGGRADGGAVVGHATSAGQVRSHNEDSVLCEPVDASSVARHGLFCAVADGMGGHAAGDVASRLAVETARDAYYASDAPTLDQALREAVAQANRAVLEAGSRSHDRAQMGSTLTAVVLVGQRALIGHVGDSRCYLVAAGQIRQLTRDHSWVAEEVEAGTMTPAEARAHPRRNVITRALGLDATVDVEVVAAEARPGSALVVCSDGLHGPVEDDEIRECVERLPPDQAADELVALANERGGPDNISVVVIRPAEPPAGAAAAAPRPAEAIADDQTTLVPVQGTIHPGRERRATSGEPANPAPVRVESAPVRRREPMAVPAPTRRRAPLLAGLLLMLLLLAGGVGIGWLLFRPSAGPASVLPAPVTAPSPGPTAAQPTAAGRGAAPATPGTAPATATTAVAVPNATAEAASAPGAAAPAPAPVAPAAAGPLLVVIDDNAAVRASPVIGAPIAARLPLGARVTSEAEVNGGPANGSSRWHLVTVATESPPVRGFVHSSVVKPEGEGEAGTDEGAPR